MRQCEIRCHEQGADVGGRGRSILTWGFILVAVLMLGAMIERTAGTGTCMFVLMPAFAAMAATYPILRVGRFGTGVLAYVPYAVIGFVPLARLRLAPGPLRCAGCGRVFVWAASEPAHRAVRGHRRIGSRPGSAIAPGR